MEKGLYRHFKGKKYEVIGVATHSETLEKMVVYCARYGDNEMWVRPYSMFCGKVTKDGITFRRFNYLDPHFRNEWITKDELGEVFLLYKEQGVSFDPLEWEKLYDEKKIDFIGNYAGEYLMAVVQVSPSTSKASHFAKRENINKTDFFMCANKMFAEKYKKSLDF